MVLHLPDAWNQRTLLVGLPPETVRGADGHLQLAGAGDAGVMRGAGQAART